MITVKPRGDYINGRFVRRRTPDDEIPAVDPGDSEAIIGDFPVYHDSPLAAVAAARTAQALWRELPPEERMGTLRKLRAELRNRGDNLAEVISAETGRPLWEAREEVLAMHLELDAYMEHALAEISLCRPPAGDGQAVYLPIGVVAVISPHPQPGLTMHLDVVAALLAGCTVVCKPSELTPATAQIYSEIVHEADLPRGVFNMVQGAAATGHTLATETGVDGVLFAGTLTVARELALELSQTARMFRPLTTSGSVTLVLDDAHVSDAAHQIAIGACLTAGQRAASTHCVLVHRRVALHLVNEVATLLQQVKVGYAADPSTFMGPLISSQAVQTYLAHLQRIGASGADELVHGAPLSSRRRGHYVTPSLLRVPAAALPGACDRELTGPLVTLSEIDDIEHAAELMHKLTPPFQLLAVHCRSAQLLDRIRRLARPSVCLHNLATIHSVPRAPLQPHALANNLSAGCLTARTCTRLQLSFGREPALDVTLLPPGFPRR